MKNIHFICHGNVFRSRLAEAIMNKRIVEQNISGIRASSSGLDADMNVFGSIAPMTAQILKNESLTDFASKNWTVTTQQIIDEADLIVLLNSNLFEELADKLKVKDIEIWNIEDVNNKIAYVSDSASLPQVQKIIDSIRDAVYSMKI